MSGFNKGNSVNGNLFVTGNIQTGPLSNVTGGGLGTVFGGKIQSGSFGSDFSQSASTNAPAIVSGTPFTPLAGQDSYLSFMVTLAGTLTLTMGPTTGAEHSVITARAVLAGSFIDKWIPAGWKVVVTLVTATIADALVVGA